MFISLLCEESSLAAVRNCGRCRGKAETSQGLAAENVEPEGFSMSLEEVRAPPRQQIEEAAESKEPCGGAGSC